MDSSHPALLATLALLLALPIGAWLSRRTESVLHRHDAALDQIDRERVTAAIPTFVTSDPLAQIEDLTQQEVALIHTILDERAASGHVTVEHLQELRQIHRQGLALRQQCGDATLDAEVGWLQAYGSLALMTDLAELDRPQFEEELAFRADEVRRTVEMRRKSTLHAHS